MALRAEFINRHIAQWEDWCRQRHAYPHRVRWPSRLFHHSPIENAVAILASGVLRSRADPQNNRPRDIAGAGVIEAREDAHNVVRFYFRPRTPTQFHVGGIRRPGECQYGDAAHAAVLVMLIFQARAILSDPAVGFTDRNAQQGAAVYGTEEVQFAAIPFDKVYHEGGIAGDHSITSHRCAEVHAASPISLADTLEAVCCRSNAEREMLLFMLGNDARKWADKILVSDDLRVFQRDFAFVQDVSLSREGLIFKLNPRRSGGTVDVSIDLFDQTGRKLIDFRNTELQPVPPTADRWRVAADLADGTYEAKIEIDGHLAYNNLLTLGDSLF
ncbi:MAG: DarT ssDNA thymidine ADP-ribosyltransferase family protein [Sphingopyxis sp.]|nr:DarT ssDNA thymidine ADP-ribosyltransferase family protein [Sphingopyxis sp.]